ncbi:MAG: pentapeptide repeat-containing protein [Geodermatophilaceae bacterium]
MDGAGLKRVRFVGCRLTGAMLSGTNLSDLTIEDSVADLVNFRAAHATYLSIEATSLREADFYTAALSNPALLDCDLSAANFTEARAPGLELHGSTLDALRGAQSLTGARIDAEQLIPLGLALVAALQVEVSDRSR